MKIVRYFFVGGIAAAIDIGLFFVFAQILGFNYLLVGAGSFLIATAVNYVLSVQHVFESGVRFAPRREIMLVFLVSAVGLGVNQAMLFVCVSQFQLHKLLAKVIATGTVFLWNYYARAHFVFKATSSGSTRD